MPHFNGPLFGHRILRTVKRPISGSCRTSQAEAEDEKVAVVDKPVP